MTGTSFFGFTNASGSGSGGGTISGTIAAPQVAFGSASNTIAGDSTFLFNNSNGDKEVSANVIKINVNSNPGALPIGKDGYLEYVLNQLYFTIGSTTYKVSLTL